MAGRNFRRLEKCRNRTAS